MINSNKAEFGIHPPRQKLDYYNYTLVASALIDHRSSSTCIQSDVLVVALSQSTARKFSSAVAANLSPFAMRNARLKHGRRISRCLIRSTGSMKRYADGLISRMACRDLKRAIVLNRAPVSLQSREDLLREFVELYQWSFERSIYFALRVQGGMDHFDYQNNVIVYDLRYREYCGGNAGLAFTLTDAAFRSRDEISANAAFILQFGQSKLLSMQLALQDKKDFVGVMVALYITEDDFFFRFHRIYHHPTWFEEKVSKLRHDLWMVELQFNIENGFIFRMLGEGDEPVARLGRMKLEADKWAWMPLSNEEVKASGMRPMSEVGLSGEGLALMF